MRFLGCRQVTEQTFVALQMPRALWDHFEELSRRDTRRYVAAIGEQRCAFIENARRQVDTEIGVTHLYVDAVYAVYRFAYQLKLLGAIRPAVRRNSEIPFFSRRSSFLGSATSCPKNHAVSMV